MHVKMESISSFIRNIKNLLPYLVLISIYFFFVNLEARKEKHKDHNSQEENVGLNDRSKINDKNFRIKIPVIPYN